MCKTNALSRTTTLGNQGKRSYPFLTPPLDPHQGPQRCSISEMLRIRWLAASCVMTSFLHWRKRREGDDLVLHWLFGGSKAVGLTDCYPNTQVYAAWMNAKQAAATTFRITNWYIDWPSFWEGTRYVLCRAFMCDTIQIMKYGVITNCRLRENSEINHTHRVSQCQCQCRTDSEWVTVTVSQCESVAVSLSVLQFPVGSNGVESITEYLRLVAQG